MEEKNTQENAFDKPIETAIDVSSETKDDDISSETKDDYISSETKDYDISSETKSRTERHREFIDAIIVPQYIDDQDVKDNNYVVTYSEEDNSILGWAINIKKDGQQQQQPDVYFKLGQKYQNYTIVSFVLYKKTLIFCYYDNDDQNCKYLL